MTRSHFLLLWTSEYITIDGMDEHLIMTVQSQSHISYSNLNRSSTQKSQEEFIFSIATVIFFLFNNLVYELLGIELLLNIITELKIINQLIQFLKSQI